MEAAAEWKPSRARSYNEHSTLPSYGSLTPSSAGAARRRRPPAHTTFRQDVWTVLRFRQSLAHGSGLQRASYAVEASVLVLILLNVVVAISESSVVVRNSAAENEPATDWYSTFLLVSTGIFSVEYLLRLWSCVEDERYHGAILGRLKWMVQPLSLIDLAALVPFYLEICIQMESPSGSTYKGALSLRSLRLLRILSFFRLERSYNAMRNLRLIFSRKKDEFLVVTYLATVVILMSAIMIFFLEHDAQPTVFSGIGVCTWWTVETITSLGYGDVVPVTTLGRAFASLLALWGVILFTIPGAVLGSGFIEVMLEKQREEDEEAFNMAFCGSSAPPSFVGLATDDEGDHAPPLHHLDSPKHGPAPSPSPSRFPLLSPTAAVALRNSDHHLHEKLDALAAGQQQLAAQLQAQQEQIAALTRLVETALPTSAPHAPAPCP